MIMCWNEKNETVYDSTVSEEKERTTMHFCAATENQYPIMVT